MALCAITAQAAMARRPEPVGAVLAGGAGLRMGGAKATVALRGRPLISYPLEAVWRALGQAVIVAKADTELPSLPGVTVWVEPTVAHHPLVGLVYALEMAEGRPVLVCAGDLAFVTAEVIGELVGRAGRARAVVAGAGGALQPLLGWYAPEALSELQTFAPDSGGPLREAVAALEPVLVEVDPGVLFNVNTPDDLLQAAAMLDARERAAGGAHRPPA